MIKGESDEAYIHNTRPSFIVIFKAMTLLDYRSVDLECDLTASSHTIQGPGNRWRHLIHSDTLLNLPWMTPGVLVMVCIESSGATKSVLFGIYKSNGLMVN